MKNFIERCKGKSFLVNRERICKRENINKSGEMFIFDNNVVLVLISKEEKKSLLDFKVGEIIKKNITLEVIGDKSLSFGRDLRIIEINSEKKEFYAFIVLLL